VLTHVHVRAGNNSTMLFPFIEKRKLLKFPGKIIRVAQDGTAVIIARAKRSL
jgi:hypothetical protein